MNNHAAGALQERFNDDGGNMVAALVEQLCQRIYAFNVAGSPFFSYRTMLAIRRMNPVHGESQRDKRLGKSRVGAHRHGAHSVAMISMLQSHDFFLVFLAAVLPVLDRHLQATSTAVEPSSEKKMCSRSVGRNLRSLAATASTLGC